MARLARKQGSARLSESPIKLLLLEWLYWMCHPSTSGQSRFTQLVNIWYLNKVQPVDGGRQSVRDRDLRHLGGGRALLALHAVQRAHGHQPLVLPGRRADPAQAAHALQRHPAGGRPGRARAPAHRPPGQGPRMADSVWNTAAVCVDWATTIEYQYNTLLDGSAIFVSLACITTLTRSLAEIQTQINRGVKVGDCLRWAALQSRVTAGCRELEETFADLLPHILISAYFTPLLAIVDDLHHRNIQLDQVPQRAHQPAERVATPSAREMKRTVKEKCPRLILTFGALVLPKARYFCN
ncbi:uncharacterized protein LOC113205075 isoform X2 [Frankliniella occidentalis]|uniref:Uncharacterized protein LOC113205075 isoform X2 n=1 Tax=Frankliniella occidentalis TaxID=133901 RepID=A0A9C6U4M0_FRAOC|nr:uncharacterized protein LOC113205075 isoform X2 [Frankliniella occidentalis]